MKILSAKQIREADLFTIKNEPISSLDLMERAAFKCFNWITQHVKQQDKSIAIISGTGNNGGDGLVISRLLIEAGYTITTYIIWLSEKGSQDFTINFERLQKLNCPTIHIRKDTNFQTFKEEILIDAIFGTGLSRPVEGLPKKIIDAINKSGKKVISIDVPSGLYADKPQQNTKTIVRANRTLTFQAPKLSFLLPDYGEFVGKFKVLDIGLDDHFIEQLPSNYYLVEKNEVIQLIKTRSKFSHKGSFGHSLLIAGSKGMMGAAILAGRACTKSGIGLLTIQTEEVGWPIIQTTVPEAICRVLDMENIQNNLKNIQNYSAIGIGPGMGKSEKAASLIKILIQNLGNPMVMDADALNILGENKTWIPFLPKLSILTPHVKEFERITRPVKNGFERIALQREFSIKNGVYVVLKGAHTSISCPNGEIFFNNTGNPGMATGGSGDVLTGLILGLLTQGYTSKEACILGVYIHGLAGDFAKETEGEEALTAQSLINNLGKAFLHLKKDNDF